jgi:5-methylcytosine-specific restriction endonuclease McrA
MTYSQKLNDPRWRAVRERVLRRDGKRCTRDPNHQMPLEVHHIEYAQNREPGITPWRTS